MKPWIWEIVEGSTPRRVARSATKLPYSRVTTPPCGRDELALVLDQVDESLLRAIDRGGDEILDSRRGERRLRHVRGELSRRRRDRSGERLGGGRQLLLDLGLDVDVGVELIDREDAELLLDVLVLEDLFGVVGELVACRGPRSEPSSRSSRRAAPPTRARRGTRRGRGDDASALAPRDPPSAGSRASVSAVICSVTFRGHVLTNPTVAGARTG